MRLAGLAQVFREGVVRDFELVMRRRDGREISVLYNAAVYRDAEGKVAGVLAAARDITEIKRTESEIIGLNRSLAERNLDGDLKCILRGISEDLPLKLKALEEAKSTTERDTAIADMGYLLNDNVEVITAPPQAPV